MHSKSKDCLSRIWFRLRDRHGIRFRVRMRFNFKLRIRVRVKLSNSAVVTGGPTQGQVLGSPVKLSCFQLNARRTLTNAGRFLRNPGEH